MIIKTNHYPPIFIESAKGDGGTMFNDLVKLDRGNMICIAARPGMGKTSLALHMALEFAKRSDKTVYVFSFRERATEIYERMICSLVEIDTYSMKTRKYSPEQWERILEAIAKIASLNIVIDDTVKREEFQITKLLDECDNLGMMIVDDWLPSRYGTTIFGQEVSMMTRELRHFSKIKNIPVIFTHTPNRNLEKRKNKRPLLKDLMGDGSLMQNSDAIIFIYRDEYYNCSNEDFSNAEIIIAKNRYDCIDTVSLEWRGRYGKSSEVDKEESCQT